MATNLQSIANGMAATDLGVGMGATELEDEDEKKKKALQRQREGMGLSGTSVFGSAVASLGLGGGM